MKPACTTKQRQIMSIILRAAGEGRLMNITELHDALPYTCEYGSLRGSVRFLVKHNILIKERSGMSVMLRPTSEAYAWFRPER